MQRLKIQPFDSSQIQLGDYLDVEGVGSSGSTLIGKYNCHTSTAGFAKQHGSVLPVSCSKSESHIDTELRTDQDSLEAYA